MNPGQHILLTLIRIYQLALSPLIGRFCRFQPTCSNYGMEAIRLHGCMKGLYLTTRRLLRCHPFHPGGYDPVPCCEQGNKKTKDSSQNEQG